MTYFFIFFINVKRLIKLIKYKQLDKCFISERSLTIAINDKIYLTLIIL